MYLNGNFSFNKRNIYKIRNNGKNYIQLKRNNYNDNFDKYVLNSYKTTDKNKNINIETNENSSDISFYNNTLKNQILSPEDEDDIYQFNNKNENIQKYNDDMDYNYLNIKNINYSNYINEENIKFLNEQHKKIKTLILDLDETLVHSSFQPLLSSNKQIIKPDISFNIFFNYKYYNIFVYKRPFLHKFLKEMNKIYNIYIFTASIEKYAKPLLEQLDKKNYISKKLYRESCTISEGKFIKDLSLLNLKLNDVILLDNNPYSYKYNKKNGLPIKTWHFDKNDKEIIKIIPLLKYLSNVDDVRKYIPYIIENDEINFNKVGLLINSSNKSRKSHSVNKKNTNERMVKQSNKKILNKTINYNNYDEMKVNFLNNHCPETINFREPSKNKSTKIPKPNSGSKNKSNKIVKNIKNNNIINILNNNIDNNINNYINNNISNNNSNNATNNNFYYNYYFFNYKNDINKKIINKKRNKNNSISVVNFNSCVNELGINLLDYNNKRKKSNNNKFDRSCHNFYINSKYSFVINRPQEQEKEQEREFSKNNYKNKSQFLNMEYKFFNKNSKKYEEENKDSSNIINKYKLNKSNINKIPYSRKNDNKDMNMKISEKTRKMINNKKSCKNKLYKKNYLNKFSINTNININNENNKNHMNKHKNNSSYKNYESYENDYNTITPLIKLNDNYIQLRKNNTIEALGKNNVNSIRNIICYNSSNCINTLNNNNSNNITIKNTINYDKKAIYEKEINNYNNLNLFSYNEKFIKENHYNNNELNHINNKNHKKMYKKGNHKLLTDRNKNINLNEKNFDNNLFNNYALKKEKINIEEKNCFIKRKMKLKNGLLPNKKLSKENTKSNYIDENYLNVINDIPSSVRLNLKKNNIY